MQSNNSVTVVGAGMVGTCCALYLQQEGFAVTLVDKGAPGDGSSFGNLGCFGIASCVPPGTPGIVKKVPGMLLDPAAPLKLRWSHALKAAPWFLRYVANTRRDRVEAIAAARQSLLSKVHETLDPLVKEAGAGNLLCPGGLLFTFESEAAFQGASYAFEIRRRHGVPMEFLSGDEAREVEPGLTKAVVRAMHVPSLVFTLDPGGLVKALSDLFERRGGTLLRRVVSGFEIDPDGVRALQTDQGPAPVENVVIAAGVWSRPLARALGTKVPLESERGYHTMFHDSDIRMNGGVLSADRYVSVTPMRDGIRVGGFAEFAPPGAPLDRRRAATIARIGQSLMPGLESSRRSEWVGSRPSHPDSKPAIGRSPRHKNAWFAFGHDHLGLTFGSITGKLISEIVAGKKPSVDLEPFRPDRF
jgi:D-amino-acid dehydrogenase